MFRLDGSATVLGCRSGAEDCRCEGNVHREMTVYCDGSAFRDKDVKENGQEMQKKTLTSKSSIVSCDFRKIRFLSWSTTILFLLTSVV